MLPSKGYFKDIPCPYFDGGNETCHRYYCHLNHVRRVNIEKPAKTAAEAAIYTPTPKLLRLSCLMPEVVVKKKVTLEYQPEKPEFDASPSKPKFKVPLAPTYVPSTSVSNAVVDKDLKFDDSLSFLEDCVEELKELTDLIDDRLLDNDDTTENTIETTQIVATAKPTEQREIQDNDKDCIVIKQEVEVICISDEENEEQPIVPNVVIKQEKHVENCAQIKVEKSKSDKFEQDVKVKLEKATDADLSKTSSSNHSEHKSHSSINKHHKLKTHSSSSTKACKTSNSISNERHKSKERSSSHSKEQKHHHRERDKEKHKDKSKEHHKDSNKTHRDRHSQRSSDRHSNKEKDRHKETNKHRHASKEHHKSATNEKTENSSTGFDKTIVKIEPMPAVELSDSLEISHEECYSLYKQIESEFAEMHTDANDSTSRTAATQKRKTDDLEEYAAGSVTQKKRLAYENAEKYKKDKIVTPRPNHARNAMHSVFARQEQLRVKQTEEAAAAAKALREAEEKVREANEALRKAKEENEKKLTPLIPLSYLTPPTRVRCAINPVSNMLALERAKKKVEELRSVKKPAFTPAQSSKAGARVAHKSTLAPTVKEEMQANKPPVLESNSTKISFGIRMQYYDMMVKHCLAIYPNAADAWERAQTEELTVLKKCNTPIIYKSSAMLAINKLRKEAIESGNKPASNNNIVSHEVILAGKLAQTTSWSVQKKLKSNVTTGSTDPFDKLSCEHAYEMVYGLSLTDEQLIANGYPRPGLRPGTAVIKCSKPMRRPCNPNERFCSRCGKIFSLNMYDEACVDECNYHPKSTGYRRGFADNQHRCCQQPAGTPGCSYANYHVTDYVDLDNLTGFVSTNDKHEGYVPTKNDIYALDCEMCYTTGGIELTRVTVVDINACTVFDALVKPHNKIVDYNTIYSGITEDMLANETRTLRDVQSILITMFHSKTILVGHSLESDLKALKLIHDVVVDTSVLFPHKLGPPKKRALKTLCIENLKRIIQENVSGHDSAEDAEVCIQLVKFYLRNKIS